MKFLAWFRMMGFTLLVGSFFFSVQSFTEGAQMNFLSVDDFAQIVRSIIDRPELQQYFHEELPGRSPLRILKQASFPERLPLSKFAVPVEYIQKENIRDDDEAYLDIGKISVENDKVIVEFEYPVEGVAGKAEFHKKDGEWLIGKYEIAER